MFRHAMTVILVFALLAGSRAVSRAAGNEGTEAVRKANDTITALLKKKVTPGSEDEKKLAKQVTDSIRDFLDIDALGQRALDTHWSKLSAAQQKEYLALLRQLIEKSYIKGLRANLQYSVVYVSESKKGEDIVVATKIETTRRGRPYTIAVDYVLRSAGGKLRAWDVSTDGVGLVENYRAQFNKIIAKDGFDGLIARMKKKASKVD